MRLPNTLVDEIDYGGAVAAELASVNRFMPPNYGDLALTPRKKELTASLKSLARRDLTPALMDTVMARKSGGGSRPLPYIALQDRLLYRALVALIADRVPRPERGREAYNDFVQFPLTRDECKFVLKTDIAAFYQYVDHERLADEVVAQTGDDVAITGALGILQAVSRRKFGLPQMTQPSDVLGDLYVEPIRRSLLRGQFDTVRYADDFRVACRTYNEALAALELAERSAHELGLVLNEAKTTTPHRETYEASLKETDSAERDIFAALKDGQNDTELEDFFFPEVHYEDTAEEDESDSLGVTSPGVNDDEIDPPPSGGDEEFEPTSTQLEAAALVVHYWNDEDAATTAGIAWSRTTRSALIQKALLVLGAGNDPAAMPHVTSILVREPHMTPQLCNYLTALSADEPTMISETLDLVCNRRIVSVWQALWVSHCAGTVTGSRGGTAHIEWLRDQVDGQHPAVAAQAILALAQRRKLDPVVAAEAYQRLPLVHKPTALIALAAARGVSKLPVEADTQIERWQAAWAAEQPWGRPSRIIRRKPAQL
ncbi:hypothetical protein BJ986_001398 [Phycicoccus badiiscoriae]|uniref:Reverse transcriptase domain-containing protein n=1 Tax=Pedococcus badiiscoriae TaxID=642776 RepID=A0A852WH97_9MICO|nr:reverse transcriptase domain-containing protein [Pedococcus badiiscoriae]NYG06911.1 hypothetical protein [Pedococcus badiiscoriae]